MSTRLAIRGTFALVLSTGLAAQNEPVAPVAAGFAITGEVCDPLGSPLARATVELRRCFDGGVKHRATTDGAGIFVLQVPTHERVGVHVRVAGHAAWARILEPGDAMARAELMQIVLEEGVELAGTVRDAAGQPIRATVTAGVADCVADAEGHYLLAHVPLGSVSVSAYAPARLVATSTVDSLATSRLDFTLAADPGRPVVLRLAGAEPNRSFVEVSAAGCLLPLALRELRFDADGKAAVRGVRRGLLSLRLRDADSGRTLGRRNVTLDDAVSTIDLSPDRVGTTTVAGRLRRQDGEPLAGVSLTLNHGTTETAVQTVTAPDGTFRCHLPDGDQPHVFAEIDGLAWVLIIQQRGHPLTPTTSARTFELTAVPACSVRGRVLDPDGNPLPFALVCLSAPARVSGHSPRGVELRTGPDGTFVFSGLSAASANLTLIVRTPRHAGRLDDIAIRTPGSEANVTLRLTTAGEVLGTVQDARGTPLAGATVRVPREFEPGGGLRPGRAVPFAEAKTNRAGKFRVGGLPPGRYQLFLQPAKPGETPHTEFTIDGGEVENLGVLTVR